MKNVKYEDMINECKDYTLFRLNKNILFVNCVIVCLNLFALWLIDVLIWSIIWSVFIMFGLFDFSIMTITFFFIFHFLYWEFSQKKNSKELIEDLSEIDLHQALKALKALKEVRKEKLKNKLWIKDLY
jgi:hypothetical protein